MGKLLRVVVISVVVFSWGGLGENGGLFEVNTEGIPWIKHREDSAREGGCGEGVEYPRVKKSDDWNCSHEIITIGDKHNEKADSHWNYPVLGVSKDYTGLFAALLAEKCGEKQTRDMEKRWCALIDPERKYLASVRCNYEVYTKVTEAWCPKAVDKSKRLDFESKVTLNHTATSNNERCRKLPEPQITNINYTIPNATMTINGNLCTVMNSTREAKENPNFCYYNMHWGNDAVASYVCPLPEAANCKESIQDAFIEGKVNQEPHNKKIPEISEIKETKAVDITKGNCTLKGPTNTETDPRKFQFTDGDNKDGEIWCTFPAEGSDTNITCEFLTPCQVEIATGFQGDWKKIKEGPKIEYKGGTNGGNSLPGKCHKENLGTGSIKKFKFDGDTEKGQIWCTFPKGGSNGKIKCEFLTPCEMAIATGFKGEWEKVTEGKKIEYKGERNSDKQFPTECEPKVPQTENGPTKKFKFENGTKTEEFWCVSPRDGGRDGISCRSLSPCEVKVREGLKDGWKKEDLEKEIEYKGDGNKLPEKCEPRENSNTEPKKFTSDGKEFWCALGKEGNPKKIECKIFPPCEVAVREALGSKVSDKLSVKFEAPNAEKNDLVGTNCSKKVGTTNDGNKAEFLFSFEKDKHHDGKLSCTRETSGNSINCSFSPNCAYTVKGAFKKENPNSAEIADNEGLNLDNTGCQETAGKRSEDVKTFIITKKGGNQSVTEISCDEKDGTITCVQLPQCEIEVKKAFTKENPREIFFGGKVTDPENLGEEIDLAGKECSPGDVENGGKIFNFTSTNGGPPQGRDFFCANSSETIKCSLLPPRCKIDGMEEKQKSPLRCNKTTNITISGGGLVEGGITCEPKEEATFNHKHSTHCEINVTIGGGEKRSYVCENNSETKEEWCQAIPPPLAKPCSLEDVLFEKGSPCKNHTGSLDVPVSVFGRLKGTCEEKPDGRTGDKDKCAITVNAKKEATFLCGDEGLKKEIKELCKKLLIPGQIATTSTGRQEKTVRLQFQSEEQSGYEAEDVKVRKIRLFHEASSLFDLWGDEVEENFTSFSNSPLFPSRSLSIPSLLLALF